MKNEKPKLFSVNEASVLPVPISPMSLISKGIDANMGVDQLEKLMDLQERHERSKARKEYFEAMNKFQANKPVIGKTNRVEHGGVYKYSFAALSDIQKAIDPILTQFDLSYSWLQKDEGGKITITCVVAHKSGHTSESFLSSEPDTSGSKNSIQAIGSIVSYLKRYTLLNSFGLSTGDDDGQNAAPSPEELNEMKLAQIQQLINDVKNVEDFGKYEKRINEIIANEESQSYSNVIVTLKKLKPETK